MGTNGCSSPAAYPRLPDTIDVDPVLGLAYNVTPHPVAPGTDAVGRPCGIPRSQIAHDAILRSNLRRVTTRFFGKSVKTCQMAARFPILPVLLIFTAGLLSAAGCGRPTGVADGPPAAVSSEKPSASADAAAKKPTASPPQFTRPQGANADAAVPPQAQQILQTAVRTLESRDGVSARIRQQVDLFGKQLVGSGVYLQQRVGSDQSPPVQTAFPLAPLAGRPGGADVRPAEEASPLAPLAGRGTQRVPGGEGSWDGLLIRLELRIQVGDQQSSLLQVLSPPTPAGHYLWTYRRLPDEERLSRVDLVRAAEALEKAQHAPGLGTEGILSGLGGLPRLLRGLEATFDFNSAEPGTFGRLPVWRLQGRWKPDRLAKILPDQKAVIEAGEPPDLTRLPEHLPDRVVLMLGQDDLFPYRVEYRRGIPEKAGGQNDGRPLVTMELFDVKLDVPIDRARFVYNPGNTGFSDETESFISSLGPAQ